MANRPRRCYLAGPMRGFPELNFPKFRAASPLLESAGWKVFSPADIFELNEDNNDQRRFVRRFTHIIINELSDGDAIVLLPGWEGSVGAQAERSVGLWCGLNVLTLEEALNEHITT